MLSGLARKDLFSPDPSPPQMNSGEVSVVKKPKTESLSIEKDIPTFKKVLDKSYPDNTQPEVNEKSEKDVPASPQKQSSMKQDELKEKKEDDIIPSFSFIPNFFFSSTQKEDNHQVIAAKSDSEQNPSKIVKELLQKPEMNLFYQNQTILEQNTETIIPYEISNLNKQDTFRPFIKSENIYSEEKVSNIITGDKNKFITVALNSSEDSTFVINNSHNIDDLKKAVNDFFPNTKVEIIQNKVKEENSLDEKNPSTVTDPQVEKSTTINSLNNKDEIKIEHPEKTPNSKIYDTQKKDFNKPNNKAENISEINKDIKLDNKLEIKEEKTKNLFIKNIFQELENIIVEKPINKSEGLFEKLQDKNNLLNFFKNMLDNNNINKLSEIPLTKIENTIPLTALITPTPKQENMKYDIEEIITIQSAPTEIIAPLRKEDANKKVDPLFIKFDDRTNNTLADDKELKADNKTDIDLKVNAKKYDNINIKNNMDLPVEKGKIEAPKENNFKRNDNSMQMSHFENSFKKEEKFSDDKNNFNDKPIILEKTISSQEKTPIVVSDKSKADFSLPIVSAATRKAIDLSTQLQARGGGTAKVSIQDDKLGQIELNIQMKKDSTVSLEIKTSSNELKTFIENGTDSLKKSLEVQNITLTDVKVSTTEKSSQTNLNSGGHFNSNESFRHSSDNNQSNQNSNQNFANTFSNQNNQKFFQNPDNDLIINPYQNAKSNSLSDKFKKVEKNSLTNIQRGANGSIKVLA